MVYNPVRNAVNGRFSELDRQLYALEHVCATSLLDTWYEEEYGSCSRLGWSGCKHNIEGGRRICEITQCTLAGSYCRFHVFGKV